MESYVKIENVDKRFGTMQDAVQYAEDNFDDEIESFEIDIYSESGELIDNQTVEWNPYSNQFVYAAWGFGVSKWNDNEYDWYVNVFDTLDQLLENKDYLSAKAKRYGLRVEKYTQTVDENIGDVVDTYEEDD